jgi:hypothetical protein
VTIIFLVGEVHCHVKNEDKRSFSWNILQDNVHGHLFSCSLAHTLLMLTSKSQIFLAVDMFVVVSLVITKILFLL